MKSMMLLLLLGTAAAASAQTNFRAVLNTSPASDITGAAAFALDGTSVRFTISITREQMVPTSASVIGPRSAMNFDLGNPLIVIHSPGPWPNGYDGSTAFFGSFILPADLLSDFVAGQTILELRGTTAGNLSGPVLPDNSPQITRFGRLGPSFQLGFRALPPYRYTVESLQDLSVTNASVFTNIFALSQGFDVTVTDEVTNAGTRLYRVRRSLCCGEE